MRARVSVLIGALILAAGCTPDLPDPASPGAKLYAERCGTCHGLYAPGALTAAMWEVQVQRMQGEMLRRRLDPLDATDQATVLAYLRAHATDAAPAGSAP